MTQKKEVKRGKRAIIKAELSGLQLLGEIITWNARGGKRVVRDDVLTALKDAGLDEKIATEVLPKHAFARAAKQLKIERTIDVVSETETEITFQFTRKWLKKSEWTFEKETTLTLHKETGKVSSASKNLQEQAQTLVDQSMVERTTNDITKIVQRLFDEHADLIPIRDQGGVYFVPQAHTEFLGKIDLFLVGVGGRLDRFPVPAGTQIGDSSVQSAVASAMSKLITDHEQAIAEFSIHTRDSTVEKMTDRIKAARVKIEAYANYLSDKQAELLKSVDAANARLREKISELAKEKEALPPKMEGEGSRQSLFGNSITAIIRALAASRTVEKSEVESILAKHGITVAPATIQIQWSAGLKGKGSLPKLTQEQWKQLVVGKKK